MKRLAYSIFAVVLFTSATLNVFAQKDETRSVSGFNSIASAGPFTVHVKIDGTESLKITADAKIIDEIETPVKNGKLEIKFKNHDDWHYQNVGRVDVYITAKSLSALYNAGSGSIKIDGNLSGSNVEIVLSGSGNITSSVKSTDVHVTISGSGSAHLSGSSNEAKVSIAGSGELLGKDFKTVTASVSIAGSGNAYLVAEKELSANIIGSGSVMYSGNATVNSKTIGSGRVSKAD